MAVLGIITCEILEREFARLLATDPDISRVTVLEDACSTRLIELLESSGSRNIHRIPHIKSFASEPAEDFEAVVRVLPLGLHRNRRVLQQALLSAARELSRCADALLLGYGLCGNALSDPVAFLDVNIPIFIPMDKNHPVDDCVGMLIGGRECYHGEQCKTPGTFFMTPGWATHWKKIFEGAGSAAPEAVKRMFAHYERSLLVITPVMEEEEMKRKTAGFSTLLGLRTETRQGTLEILTESWNSAKLALQMTTITRPGE